MDVLYMLIPMSLVFVLFIVAVLFWASASGQFDDLHSPGSAVLMDEDGPPPGD